jgi:hypothetical protein
VSTVRSTGPRLVPRGARIEQSSTRLWVLAGHAAVLRTHAMHLLGASTSLLGNAPRSRFLLRDVVGLHSRRSPGHAGSAGQSEYAQPDSVSHRMAFWTSSSPTRGAFG